MKIRILEIEEQKKQCNQAKTNANMKKYVQVTIKNLKTTKRKNNTAYKTN